MLKSREVKPLSPVIWGGGEQKTKFKKVYCYINWSQNQGGTVFTRLRNRRVVMCLVVVYIRLFVRSFLPSLIESRVFNIF